MNSAHRDVVHRLAVTSERILKMARIPSCILCCGLAAVSLFTSPATAGADPGAPGLRVPKGFEVSLYADDDLAHDNFSMTVDPHGRIVVSGPGYIRILIDEDGDGRADSSRLFASPENGAQGMAFHGNDLLCTTGEGLVRYRDSDGDGQADGPPDLFLKMKTGGEHDAHAIRQGPDGWWYVIVGNNGGIGRRYNSTGTAPVPEPRNGVIYRLRPDLSAGEVVADGFRNAYDFDFTSTGELITFDSDGERDISLPWYRPTRAFHVLPASNAGWISTSWKQPDDDFDMPPVIASFGRGSPSGVVCYRHTQFPESLQGAVFLLDWTYGKVFALPLQPSGATYKTKPIVFVTSVGEYGFAPTDAVVGPDGSLYVCVGGRGTRGSVYRISVAGKQHAAIEPLPPTASREEQLEFCLNCPDPCSSWGRRLWEPLAATLREEPFIHAALDNARPPRERLRAIEILTEKFHGLDTDLLQALSSATHPAIRARAAWSIGRTQPTAPKINILSSYLLDQDPLVSRTAIEALFAADSALLSEVVEPIGQLLGSQDRYVRQAAARLLERVDETTFHRIAEHAVLQGWHAGIALAAAYSRRNEGGDPYSIDVALRVLRDAHPPELQRDAVRLLMLGLGDAGPSRTVKRPPVFDGYASPLDLSAAAQELEPLLAALPAIYPTGTPNVDYELARILAMVQPPGERLLATVLAHIDESSHPVDDLHHLIVAARLPAARAPEQTSKIAAAIATLDNKISEHELLLDSHWDDRVLELYGELVQRDPDLPVALLRTPGFGRSAHAKFLPQLSAEYFEEAVNLFVSRVMQDPDRYEWTPDTVLLLSQTSDPAVYDLLRSRFDDFGLRASVIIALAQSPDEVDRDRFVQGLDVPQVDALGECVRALNLLPPSKDPAENVALVRTLRRLAPRGDEGMIRDQVVEALRRNTGSTFDYKFGRDDDVQVEAVARWTEFARTTWPEEFARQTGDDVASAEQLERLLADVVWEHGDVGRGEELFRKRACIQCHGSGGALGPDLRGVAHRFSREDLFTAIALPNRDVSSRYQTTLIVTKEGETFTGLIVYESVDGLVLRDPANRTYRIEAHNIELRRTLRESLMPSGLLKGLGPADLADLYAYLQTLEMPSSGSATTRTAER